MTELIDTTEMYLRTVFELEEESVPVLRARIVERLGHSGPTVSQTVARMERDGLLRVRADRSVELLEPGRLRATRVMRKHRLAERLLADVIGLEFAYVHDEACRWEHVVSERVERRIIGLLDDVYESPYGNPIPGLAELGVDPPAQSEAVAPVALRDVPADVTRVRIVRFGELMQVHAEELAALEAAGVLPGALAVVTRGANGVTVRADGPAGAGVMLPAERLPALFVVPAA